MPLVANLCRLAVASDWSIIVSVFDTNWQLAVSFHFTLLNLLVALLSFIFVLFGILNNTFLHTHS